MTKVCEGTLAGCLIIGNIPFDEENLISQFMININMSDSDEYIINVVSYWLSHDNERINRVKIGQKIVLQHYTWDVQGYKLLDCYDKYKNNNFGCYFTNFVRHHNRYKNTRLVPNIQGHWISNIFYNLL